MRYAILFLIFFQSCMESETGSGLKGNNQFVDSGPKEEYLLVSPEQLTDPANSGKVALVEEDIDLNGQTYILAEGIILQSEGGIISNGTLKARGDDFEISLKERKPLFDNVLKITQVYEKAFYPEWLVGNAEDLIKNALEISSYIQLDGSKIYTEDVGLIKREGLVRIDGQGASLRPFSNAKGGGILFFNKDQEGVVENLKIDAADIRSRAIRANGHIKIDNVEVLNIAIYEDDDINSEEMFGVYISGEITDQKVEITNSLFNRKIHIHKMLERSEIMISKNTFKQEKFFRDSRWVVFQDMVSTKSLKVLENKFEGISNARVFMTRIEGITDFEVNSNTFDNTTLSFRIDLSYISNGRGFKFASNKLTNPNGSITVDGSNIDGLESVTVENTDFGSGGFDFGESSASYIRGMRDFKILKSIFRPSSFSNFINLPNTNGALADDVTISYQAARFPQDYPANHMNYLRTRNFRDSQNVVLQNIKLEQR